MGDQVEFYNRFEKSAYQQQLPKPVVGAIDDLVGKRLLIRTAMSRLTKVVEPFGSEVRHVADNNYIALVVNSPKTMHPIALVNLVQYK